MSTPMKMTGPVCLRAIGMRRRGMTWERIAYELGVSRQTLHNHLRTVRFSGGLRSGPRIVLGRRSS
jgi:DNA-binding CsgD family transcriptional regulator